MKKPKWWFAVLFSLAALAIQCGRVFWEDTWRGFDPFGRRPDASRTLEQAERNLKTARPEVERSKMELNLQRQKLQGQLEQQQCLLERSAAIIEEFRTRFAAAEKNGSFPIVVRDEAYTKHQVEEQVALLVAQAKEQKLAVGKIKSLLESAELAARQLGALEVRAEQEISLVPLRRALVQANELHERNEELVKEIEIQSLGGVGPGEYPVRSLRQLLASEEITSPSDVR